MWEKNFIFEILNIVLLLDFILIGGVLPLLERKYLALIQRRVGPKYVGYKGRLQFLADSLKVLWKNYFYAFRVNKYFFFFLPFLFLTLNLYLFMNMIFKYNISTVDIELNIIYILILSAGSNFLMFLVGFFCRNKYTVISSSRIINVFFVNELLLTIIICQYIFISNSFSFLGYTDYQSKNVGFWLMSLYLPTIVFIFLLDINRVPFDYVEAESELISGYTNEYMGFLFGLFVLIEYIHIFFFSYFLVILMFW